MYSNHFIFSYRGNKRKEVKDIFNIIEPHLNNIEIVIEPFCGSSAFSYFLSLKYPKRFKYILNDFDKNLIKLYKLLQNDTETKQLIEDLKKKNQDIDKEKYLNIFKHMDDHISNFVYCSLIFCIRPGLFPCDINKVKNKNMDKLLERGIIHFLRTENIEIICGDGTELIKKYKDDNNVMFFIDPPYLLSCNAYYDMSCCESKNINIYQYLSDNPINDFNAYICIVLEKNWIIELLFKNNIKSSIAKMYQTSKKKQII